MVMAEMENNDYYNKSLKALIEYIEQEKKTITEVEWNRYAFKTVSYTHLTLPTKA